MLQSSTVDIEEQDNSSQVVQPILGIAAIEGVCRRGPVNRPDLLMQNVTMWRRIYGGVIPTSDFPFQAEKILNAGGQLRINGIRHYTDITDKTSLTALPAALATSIKNATPTGLFTFGSKYPGADYNNVRIVIAGASNGKADYFNLSVVHLTDPQNGTEPTYENLLVTNTTIGNSHYLDTINNQSEIVKVTYLDTSAIVVQTRPVDGTYALVGGSDGDAVVAADYIGDNGAKTGLYAFDGFDDFFDVAIPVISDTSVNTALALYADNRKDIQALIHLPHTIQTADEYVTARGTTDTKYQGIFAGGIIKVDANTKAQTTYSEIADIININNYVDKKFHPWTSRANFVRGIIKDASGVVNNFAGDQNSLNTLAGNQINMIINKKGKIFLKGNFSGQVETTKASFFNIVRGLIFLKKSLEPTLEKYLEEPNDLPTWIKLAKEVEPFLDSLTTGEFFYQGAGQSKKGYDWKGDQDVSDITQVVINNLPDINLGIYKVILDTYPINSIQKLSLIIGINSVDASVSIDINF